MVSNIEVQALKVFVTQPVTQEMLHKVVVTTLQVLPCKESKTYSAADNSEKPLPSLMTFLSKLVRYTNVYTGTLMATLVYLNRLKLKLPKTAQGLPCTRHRILLSCLILAAKNLNDSSPKNIHWAQYTDGLFSVKDINLMERQLLHLLNWDLKISNDDMCLNLHKFLEPIKQEIVNSENVRKYLQKKQQQADAMQQYLQQKSLSSVNAADSVSSTAAADAYPSPCVAPPSNAPPLIPVPQLPQSTSSISLRSNISRSSSVASTLSLTSHGRNGSVSSISSSESSPVQHQKKSIWNDHNHVDPRIELTAQNEEAQLNNMLKLIRARFNHSNTLPSF
ncbi:uncharacterized protein KQ657_000800 [Scheffersomyces spartinae]|uniref:Cyclin-like domain-containing protein n=1 Tax=Scheffersomyces spartinae TaxID=45513 RepID=A0A9P7V8X1_9ASCO|nr:uncharacterized protein KQ657_000800 [Scheffersomyces spartinae]KAG7193382.1 hypothetical protein KQ657_000800 [Scheffersomyces spartinae]